VVARQNVLASLRRVYGERVSLVEKELELESA